MRTMNNLLKTYCAIFLLLIISSSCNYYENSQEKRTQYAVSSTKTVTFAAVGSNNNSNLFIDGIKLAVKEMNEKSGLMGKKIKLKIYDYDNSIEKSKRIARKIARDPKIIAVIGFPESRTAIPAAITFEKHGILFISTGSTCSSFKQYDFVYSFRNIPSNQVIAKQTALFAERNNFNRIIMFVDLNYYHQKLSNLFQEASLKRNIQIVYQKTYFNSQNDFKQTLTDIKRNFNFDAFFLNGDISSAAMIIQQARQTGMKQPFLTNLSFDTSLLWTYIGNNAAGTIVPTVFDPGHTNSKTILFVKEFRKEYDCFPDTWAALGYDALYAIEQASRNVSSTNPYDIASSLKMIDNFSGVTGNFSFTHDSKQSQHSVIFKTAVDNKFIYNERDLYTEINIDEVIEERTLRIPIPWAFETIDPGVVVDNNSIEICEQLFLGLTDFSKDNYQPVPELAKEWTVSADGMIYTFLLRDDVRWTDGKNVTAYDVEWAIHRNLNLNQQFGFLNILKNAAPISNGKIKDLKQLGVKAIDNYSLKFILEKPATYFPSLVSLPCYRPLPKHIIEKFPDQWTNPDKIVTNGSYQCVYLNKEKLAILRKNPNYYESEKVSIPEIRYYVIKNNKLGLLLYQQNELDIIGNNFMKIPTEDIRSIKSDPVYMAEYKEVPLFQVDSFIFNQSIPPFDNVLVRKALVAAINKKLIKAMISKGNFEITKMLSSPGSTNEKEFYSGIGIDFSIRNAKKWFAQAGYSHSSSIGDIHLVSYESERNKKVAIAIKESLLCYLNINIIIHLLSWEDYIRLMHNPDNQKWHLLKISFYADYPDPNNWLNDLILSLPNYNNIPSQYLNLVNAASSEKNPTKRIILYKKIEKMICEQECIIAPILHETGQYLVKPRVKGWYNMVIGGQHIRNWSLDH